MGTVVTVQVVGHGDSVNERQEREEAVRRALRWFDAVTERCSRFDPTSELSELCANVGRPVAVSPLLFEAIRFALEIARDTEGAFDPVVGATMVQRGFDTEFRTGRTVAPTVPEAACATFRDVRIDEHDGSVTLDRALLLDLGAVAKGLAVDLAARELRAYANFAIDAGGDLFLAGSNPEGQPWSVGIRNPRHEGEIIDTVRVSNAAVCTSGDYERTIAGSPGHHHIVDGRSRATATGSASVTVLAPSTMVADAFSTAAFALGPGDGLALLQRHGLEGMVVTPDLQCLRTAGWPHDR